ncbi:protein-tyrosine phosphatase-like protein [Lipomyces tetrasporus]|uniref:phosphatidylinositol-3,4,5-trisphosphate 3-phosphatase n=1 Tax=Lipomyces tetrasporus TaxID=54092 RepID=A0AAD7QTU2_9ASCO|nr:protein-tyrosine phosphatase-like protein [Lipomyces tetrasporus]KAJ8101219.1 protein-tyrosine phosphatase-like protein [Lipomyces tetrasporus]
MAEFLRSAIASPRARHYDPVADTYLDLAYLEKNIIVCSMPTNEFPRVMYRNSLSDLRKLLNLRHGNHWHVWEFRAEGAGYEDSELYNRVSHFPFPDHNPPPFAMIPTIVSSLHKFLSQNPENVAVLHCKAGKGRSGTIFCAYLISQHHWTAQIALAHFTSKRMRIGFGEGVSIISQRRWIQYVETWSRDPNKEYRDIPAVVTEVRILNPVKGLEVRCCGFKEHGRRIVTLYEFTQGDHVGERVVAGGSSKDPSVWFGASEESVDSQEQPTKPTTTVSDPAGSSSHHHHRHVSLHRSGTYRSIQYQRSLDPSRDPTKLMTGTEIILRPKADIHITADVNITVEKKIYGPAGLSFLSATSYVWFNVFFEGDHDTGGTFSAAWEDMDGFKGTKKRGGKIFDRLEVDWVVCHPMELPAQPEQEIDLRASRDSIEQNSAVA